MTTIIELIEKAGLTPKLVSSSAGEYSCSCPKCGGTDRFRLWTEANRWYCRGCNAGGDLVEYFHVIEGLPYPDAFASAGRPPEPRTRQAVRATPKAWQPKSSTKPADAWHKQATELAEWSHAQLLGNDQALRWLEDERGISLETVRRVGLGWNQNDIYTDREAWGLPQELNEKGNSKKVFIPAGLVIPCRSRSGDLLRVKIRRSAPDATCRYWLLAGGATDPAIWGNNSKAVVIVESELDAVIVAQDAGDIACAVALGSAAIRPDESTASVLRSAENVLLSLDTDEAGAKAAWSWWRANFPKAKRWPVPSSFGKDPSEARNNGLPIREWVNAAISTATRTPRADPHTEPATPTASGSPSADLPELVNERAAIREIDGNATRAAAIRAAILEYHPDGRCYRCRGRNWWASIHGEIICERCHEPAEQKIVELRVSFDESVTEKAA